jgi:preprotein translocase subunit YajC
MMFISSAWAQQAGGLGSFLPSGMEGAAQFVPLILIFAVFYFLLIRPQQRKMKLHREMLSQVSRGDKIVTSGGLVGSVIKVLDENEVQVEIAEGVRVRVMRSMISNVLNKGDGKSETTQS